ncbi:MAG TPA: RNA polymerase sigma factor [Acidimicrobiales bacterium]|nr:RNA polymerase sigma factor [Acidimicrobiales bacterium]
MGRERNQEAAAVYRELAPAVMGYLRAQQVRDAEDLLGEIFLQVARDLHRVRGDAMAVRRWVFSVARHRVIDEARRRARRPALTTQDVPDRPAGPEQEPFDTELLDALGRLTADQREVVVLRFVADLSLEEVARVTHRRVGAVKALQHRALNALAATVSPESSPAL